MAWNEPGNNGNGNDPWGGGRRGGDQGPPDIDEVIKNLSKKVNGLFGSGSGSGGSSGGGASQAPGNMSAGLLVGLVAVAAIIWGFMGFYVVDEAERGVVLRLVKCRMLRWRRVCTGTRRLWTRSPWSTCPS